MSAPYRAAWAARLTLAAVLLSPTILPAQEESPPPVAVPKKDDGVTVLARGPIHEAFAQPSEAKPEPGLLVPKKPPAPIAEVPPDQRPKGENVQWIPGYWSWDLEKKDFIWVSGVWRVPPPGRKWVAGYWHQATGGWQWVSGFWAPAQATPSRYLQEPPDSLDNGPSSPQPDADSSYIPGAWVPRGAGYAWRPGFWNNNYSEWIWNPDGYYWTPAGYLYNPGYWDYNLEDRGLLFAPVYFNQPYWNTPGWTYTPSYCVGFPGLFASLFFGPNNCYYFGNYYSPFYRAWGFLPWAFWGPRYHNCLWTHYAWRNRFNPGWANAQRNLAAARFNHQSPLPASTLAGQHAMAHQVNAGNGNHHSNMVTPLHQMAGQRPLTHVSPSQLSQHRVQANQFQQHAVTRGWNEAAHAHSVSGAGPTHGHANMFSAPHNYNGGVPHHTYNSGVHAPAYRAPSMYTPHSASGYYGHGMPAYHQAMPAYHHAMPAYHQAMPAYHQAMPSYHHAAPAYHHAAPAYHHAAPAYHHAAPAYHGGFHGGGGHMSGGHHGGHR